jgi:hypothetical protein
MLTDNGLKYGLGDRVVSKHPASSGWHGIILRGHVSKTKGRWYDVLFMEPPNSLIGMALDGIKETDLIPESDQASWQSLPVNKD